MKTKWVRGSRCPDCSKLVPDEFAKQCPHCGYIRGGIHGYIDHGCTGVKMVFHPWPYTFGLLGRWRVADDQS